MVVLRSLQPSFNEAIVDCVPQISPPRRIETWEDADLKIALSALPTLPAIAIRVVRDAIGIQIIASYQ